ncbi:hypothetical protein L7F22_056908 [Adiantum nelumboides]|nr:hypothetical protein [Adiantum nelumboides]
MKLVEDILREHPISHTSQPIFEGPRNSGTDSVANVTKPLCDKSCDHETGRARASTEADEEDEFGNMTLKEMHCLLRRNARKFLKNPSSSSMPLQEAQGNRDSKVDKPLPSRNCSVQLGVLELHLDSSTSNSAESGDDASPCSAATSCHKPIDSMVVKCETLTIEDLGLDSSVKKRKAMPGSLLYETGISLEDDDCTLQMWQAHRRRLRGCNRSGGSAGGRVDGMVKLIPSDSSLKPVDTRGLCSLNAPLNNADVNKSLLSTVVQPSDAPFLEIPDSGSFASHDLKKNSSLDPPHDSSIADCSLDDGLDFKLKTGERGSTCREDSEGRQGHSSFSSGDCLWDHELDTGSKVRVVSSWSFRPCNVVDVSVSGHSKDGNSHRLSHKSMTLDEIARDSDEHARPTGQSRAMEEPCTMTCNEDNRDSTTGTASSGPCLEVIDAAACPSEPGNNQNVCYSQNTSSKESFSAHCSEDSPSFVEPETGHVVEDISSQNMRMACQIYSEEVSDSPVTLFSTERLDAEEEQEVEQLKPSKIPCKRKAISPLSRERLLQASKCGEPECPLHEEDKRGFRKLPRAFKGFIGRDTANYDGISTYTKVRNTGSMESSPSENLLHREEVPPGSPCHNRKKFLSVKSFPPKASLSSSYGTSVVGTTIASSVQASLQSPSCVQRLSLVLNSSPSPPLQQNLKAINGKSPTNVSPSIPTKSILRSSPPICQGACKCEECASLRRRAESAAEFSQRQMHDIEGLAVRLLKELNTMRCVVEKSLNQRTAQRVDGPHSASSSPEQARRAAHNALETEKMAKSWLVRMARDCNRYCKIMRMQERRLTFADESGGQLCHIKLFHSQPKLVHDGARSKDMKEQVAMPPSGNEDSHC